ncbi:hypothetical protein [Viridibacillus arvi]|uniref:hypothetical protein n=1 Tax=Viridibacillus arvi TaxID=263475 RepID=UPI0034CE9039
MAETTILQTEEPIQISSNAHLEKLANDILSKYTERWQMRIKVYVGKEARSNFINEFLISGKGETNTYYKKGMKKLTLNNSDELINNANYFTKVIKLNGCTMYKDMPERFKDKVVVFVFNTSDAVGTIEHLLKTATLVHELTHAKQYLIGNNWMYRDSWIKKTYYKIYYWYPTEVEAFFAGTWFLIKQKRYIPAIKYVGKVFCIQISVPLIIVFSVLVLLMLIS